MLWPTLLAGFLLGFGGSLHCIGMCGPLSLALPIYHLSASRKLICLFLYQAGRVLTYSMLGLLAGLAGRFIYIAGLQQWFSIVLGILILVFSGIYRVKKSGLHFSFLGRLYYSVQTLLGKLLSRQAGAPGFLMLGMANGLLPCGMVYIALASALSFPSIYQSIGFMTLFGSGTLPAMMLAAYAGQLLKPENRKLFRKMVPLFITVTGILLILRGLNLGIHFISPDLPEAGGSAVSCPH